VVGKTITRLLSIPENWSIENGEHSNEASHAIDSSVNAEELAAAEAAGHARASQQNNCPVGLERLVAASGFGRLHYVQVRTKPHRLVGKNVTVIDTAPPAPSSASGAQPCEDTGDNESSIASGSFNDSNFRTIKCRTSIAPIVSSPSLMESSMISDREQTFCPMAKKRKMHDAAEPHLASNKKPYLRPIITHYVIQLQHEDETSGLHGSEESSSSNSSSVQARLLGLTKPELRKQQEAVGAALARHPEGQVDEEEVDGSETSDTREQVAAIG